MKRRLIWFISLTLLAVPLSALLIVGATIPGGQLAAPLLLVVLVPPLGTGLWVLTGACQRMSPASLRRTFWLLVGVEVLRRIVAVEAATPEAYMGVGVEALRNVALALFGLSLFLALPICNYWLRRRATDETLVTMLAYGAGWGFLGETLPVPVEAFFKMTRYDPRFAVWYGDSAQFLTYLLWLGCWGAAAGTLAGALACQHRQTEAR